MYKRRPRDSYRTKTVEACEAAWRKIHQQDLTRPWDTARMGRRVGKVLDADILMERVPNTYGNNDRIVNAAANDHHFPYESLVERLARLAIKPTDPAHGREYAYNYVHLVDRLVNRDAGKIVRDEFKKAGLKYSKRRAMTDEQREEVAERLLAAKTDKIIAEMTERIKNGEL